MPEERQGPEGALALGGVAAAALAALEASRERLDDLNVYPVPDGDTGTNMVLTMRAVHEALAGAGDVSPPEGSKLAVRAALMGARGNSGVILSQLVRGAAEVLDGATVLDAHTLARALRGASDAAYASVREPQEGTILSVARALAEGAEAAAERGLAEALLETLEAGEEALLRTPEQLPILKEAGVVDAGGAGLLEAFRGVTAALRGEPLPEPAQNAGEGLPLEAIHQELSKLPVLHEPLRRGRRGRS